MNNPSPRVNYQSTRGSATVGYYSSQVANKGKNFLILMTIGSLINVARLYYEAQAVKSGLTKCYGQEYTLWYDVVVDDIPLDEAMNSLGNSSHAGRKLTTIPTHRCFTEFSVSGNGNDFRMLAANTTMAGQLGSQHGDPRLSKNARLFQRMYEQHGTPMWAGALFGSGIFILISWCVVNSYVQQIEEFEQMQAQLGVFKRSARSNAEFESEMSGLR